MPSPFSEYPSPESDISRLFFFHSQVEGAITKFIASDDPIVLTDYPNPVSRTITFANRATGALEQVPVTFLSTTPTTANRTRARPEAYLIPRTWSALADRLRDAGVEVETLADGYRGPAEALTITSAQVAGGYYEGAVQVTVTADLGPREGGLALPPGSFRVGARQKNAAFAFVALEPENVDSYVRFNLIPVEVGDEYPIFRIPREG